MDNTSGDTTPLRRSTYVPLPQDAFRSGAREDEESISAMRGIMFGMAFSLPIWALIIGGIAWFMNSR